jgi:hypothetical protein
MGHPTPEESTVVNLPKKYNALRAVSAIYLVAAILVLAGSFIAGFIQFAAFADSSRLGAGLGILTAFASVVGGSIVALTLFAASQAISVVLDIEENTRRAALVAEARHFRDAEVVAVSAA